MKNVPAASVDVSKRFSDMCILSPENEVLARVKIYHDLTSMKRAEMSLRKAEQAFGNRPVIVMESTSHYHLLLFQSFQENGYEVIVINPLQSNALKNIQVRKLKTDKVDAYKLAMLYRVRVLRPSQVPMDAMRGFRLLCRQRSELMCDITRFKNRLTTLLDQIFPGYDKAFADVGGVGSLAVLAAYPTPQILLTADPEKLAVLIRKANVKGGDFGRKKAGLLFSAAKDACQLGLHAPGNAAVILTTVTMLNALNESKTRLEQEIRDLTTQDKYLRGNIALLQTIPGIGIHSAAVILSEIGDFSLFQKPKQLAAYFGLDPSERQSGTFRSSRNKLSKRGSHYVRAMLNMAAHNSVYRTKNHQQGNLALAEFYEKSARQNPRK